MRIILARILTGYDPQNNIPRIFSAGCTLGGEVPPKDFLVCEFRDVKFDLNLCAVDRGISGFEEGNGVLHPLFGGVPFSDDLLEHLALVPVRIVQKVGASEERSRRKKSGEGGGVGADADLLEDKERGSKP